MSFYLNTTKNHKKYYNDDNFLSHDPIIAKFRPEDQSSLIRSFGWGQLLTVIKNILVLILNLRTSSSFKWSFLDVIAIQVH